jgi:hypothetical protein
MPRGIGLMFETNWSIWSRAGEATSFTETAVAPAAAFGQPDGAGAGAGAGAPAPTFALGTLVAWVDPVESFAETATRIVLPASPAATLYVCPVAPEMSWHAPPFASHTRHWYLKETGPLPVHLPGSAVNVLPTDAVPFSVGSVVLVGPAAVAATCALGALVAVLEPCELLAITRARSVFPASPLRS